MEGKIETLWNEVRPNRPTRFAVNVWIGDDRSTTSFHKDHYENLYAVVTGQKHFLLLLPPTDLHRMYAKEYPAVQYSYSPVTGEFELEMETPPRYVPWSSVDPYPDPNHRDEQLSKFPLFFKWPKPFRCTSVPSIRERCSTCRVCGFIMLGRAQIAEEELLL